MSSHEYSASTRSAASILLPKAEVISLPTARHNRVAPGTFTKATVRRVRCRPGQSEAFFWDASCRGFGIRALHSGRRTWIYQYRDKHGRTRRIALGDVSAVNLDAAREAARLQAASVVQGANPSVERKTKRTAGSVLDVVDAYLRYAKERQKTRSYKETERHLRIHTAPIHHERAEVVGRRDIAALLERVAKNSGPVAANRLRATLSALWIWALRTGLINADSNPVAFTIRHPERARERVLNNAELKAVWGATNDDGDYSRIVRAAARRARSFRTMVAYRDYEYPLLRNGHSANFTTVEEAQRAAEAHASEGYPNSETIYDGFAFLPNADPWWSYPNRIAIRSSVVGSVARRH